MGLQYSATIATHLVLAGQITDETIDIQGPVRNTKPMRLCIVRVKMVSKYITGEINTAVVDQPLFPVIRGCRYVFLGEPTRPVYVAAVETRPQTMDNPETVTNYLLKSGKPRDQTKH